MKLFTSYLVVVATAIAAFASVAQASNPSPAVRALQIRGQGMDALCDSPTLSREGFVALCGTKGAATQPTRAELRALQIRGEAMDVAAAVPAAVTSPSGFDWRDFGIGAASMLGFVLLAGGIATGVRYSRKGSVQPRPAS